MSEKWTRSNYDAAVLFGSYLENYGDHHDWCGLEFAAKSERPCDCGYQAALDELALFHKKAVPYPVVAS